nr:hypothetical protein [Tanacetum cinerariifolium]
MEMKVVASVGGDSSGGDVKMVADDGWLEVAGAAPERMRGEGVGT